MTTRRGRTLPTARSEPTAIRCLDWLNHRVHSTTGVGIGNLAVATKLRCPRRINPITFFTSILTPKTRVYAIRPTCFFIRKLNQQFQIEILPLMQLLKLNCCFSTENKWKSTHSVISLPLRTRFINSNSLALC